ncbi:MAG: TIGR03663 family protein [Candidatus Hydrogenedentes bacterium]|nr:TIGR03663 family protein [Candidatus Hydrogenedentota bacterium]
MTNTTVQESSRAGLALVLIALAVALAFRVPDLKLKPFHGDEANQAYKAGKILLETGVYTYDPIEHHGPTIYYLALPAAWLTTDGTFAGTVEATYRIVPVLFGAVIVLLLLPLRTALGNRATFIAALLTATSPAMVYYSRYYIQEMLLVFFAFGAIAAGWRYTQRPSLSAAIAGGLCIGLAHASKETCVLAFASYVGAGMCTVGWSRLRDGKGDTRADLNCIRARHAALCAIAAASVSVLFFSSFFTHWRGVLDSVLTYANYTNKAGSPHIHDKPWHYYLQMLLFTRNAPYPWFSEALILALGALGIRVALSAKRSHTPHANLLRFLAFYTLGMTAVYSIIPYKTPWCALNFLQPLIVMAGVGADALIRGLRLRAWRVGVSTLLALLAGQLAWQAYLACYVYHSDVRNPYVYGHTSSAIKRLEERLDQIAAVSPEGYDTLAGVLSPTRDYWPLPWYLRKFDRVGFWDTLPPEAGAPIYSAPIVIASSSIARELNAKLPGDYHSEMHALRPGVLLTVFIRTDLWEAFMATRVR